MMHPLAGVFLVTEANYRRERAIANFGPFRRNRHEELDSVHQPAVFLPRQRTESDSSSREGTAAQHQHAA
ncbi:MAG: hypothetical protein ACJ71T_13920 [Actinomycetales bacterium]|jgi:hypothetical protein